MITLTPALTRHLGEGARRRGGGRRAILGHGDQHCFAASTLPSHDADAAALTTKRILDFLCRVG